MSFLNKIFPFVSSKRIEQAHREGALEGARLAKRSYAAGQINRLTSDFLTTTTSINADIRMNISAVRERARDLYKNNPHVRRFINLCRQNIVGPLGFKLQMNIQELAGGETVNDEAANKKIEDAFADWSKAENCSVNGRYTFRQLQDIMITSAARDGEVLLRIVKNKSFKHGIALQLLDPTLIDEKYSNQQLENGNYMQMGVEIDQWRRPIAYHIHDESIPNEVWTFGVLYSPRKRVPADEIILGFIPDFPTQTRGMSWLAPGLIECNHHDKYDEAVVVNARIGAANMLILADRKVEGSRDLIGDDTDAGGNNIFEAEPGGAFYAGDHEVTQFKPEFPSAQYEMFDRACLRRLASAWNVSYGSLSNDLSQANYGSNRVGMLEEREGWKLGQQWFIETFLLPIFKAWLEESYLAGQINLPVASKFDKFNKPIFVGRRWTWIDPLKDVVAELSMIEAGLKTATQSLAERGDDILEIYKELASEKKLAEKYNLKLSINELVDVTTKLGSQPPQKPVEEDDSTQSQTEKKSLRIIQQVKAILMEDAKNEMEFENNRHNGNGKH